MRGRGRGRERGRGRGRGILRVPRGVSYIMCSNYQPCPTYLYHQRGIAPGSVKHFATSNNCQLHRQYVFSFVFRTLKRLCQVIDLSANFLCLPISQLALAPLYQLFFLLSPACHYSNYYKCFINGVICERRAGVVLGAVRL